MGINVNQKCKCQDKSNGTGQKYTTIHRKFETQQLNVGLS